MSDPLSLLEERVDTLRHIPTPTLMDALWVKGRGYIRGAGPLSPGTQMVCRAVAMPFVPFRSGLAVDKSKKEESAEYMAVELCGPGDVLVVDAIGLTYSSIGGGIKL